MPWLETRPMDERVRFIAALESCLYTMTELCRVFGISRKTGYKWAHRYAAEGVDGLKDRSRAPKGCPHRTPSRCVEALLEERCRHPRWGPRKLLAVLERRHPGWSWPAPSTAGEILKRHGLVEPRKRRRRSSAPGKPRVQAETPNALWTTDFKGEFRTGDGQWCYPLTVVDRYSRYVLVCEAQSSTSFAESRPHFERLFEQFGLPQAILHDGGPPFSSPRSPRRLSRLGVWWIRLGIRPIVIEPAHPEQNGSHERMHRTLKAETTRPPAADQQAQQDRFDHFRREYNEQRPHEALDMRMPDEIYQPSERPYPDQLPGLEYPGHFEKRRVRQNGEIKWRGERIFLSEVLGRQTVGLEEVDDEIWSIYFGPMLLGRLDEREDSLDLL